jgi:hypothetical protein
MAEKQANNSVTYADMTRALQEVLTGSRTIADPSVLAVYDSLMKRLRAPNLDEIPYGTQQVTALHEH